MIKTISENDLKKADDFQQRILNPEKKKRYRTFGFIKKSREKNPSFFLYYFEKNTIKGILFAYNKRKHLHVGEIAVDEKFRGTGIGKKLINEIEKRAMKMGKEKIVLGARESAEKFYAKLGYFPILFIQTTKKYPISNEKKYRIINKKKQGKWTKLRINSKCSKKIKEKAEKDFRGSAIFLFEKML